MVALFSWPQMLRLPVMKRPSRKSPIFLSCHLLHILTSFRLGAATFSLTLPFSLAHDTPSFC